jgi:4-hydroxy-4-methyl-2-oxoglutarate aldolase
MHWFNEGKAGPRVLANEQDIELFDRMASQLYVAVISDVLDALGYRDQVLSAGIVPVNPVSHDVLVGRAATVLTAPQYEIPEEPYTNVIAAIDALKTGDVVVIGTGGYVDASYWGELFSNAALARGARGTVIDGYHRDTRQIAKLRYPLFSTGARPFDVAGRATVVSHGRPIRCGGVLVRPGDIVFAEIDGIAVIPAEVADETVTKAFEKVAKEDRCRDDLRAGALLGEVWRRYKVL